MCAIKDQCVFSEIVECLWGVLTPVRSISIGETIWIGKKEDQRSSILVRAYLAGHVLGAAMFFCAHQGDSVLYSGDYNMSSDRHLGGGSVDRLRPSLLVTESTCV
jgi:Cft2 family RNA processing exonuclease